MGHDSMSKVSTEEYVAAYHIAIYDQTAVIKYYGHKYTLTPEARYHRGQRPNTKNARGMKLRIIKREYDSSGRGAPR